MNQTFLRFWPRWALFRYIFGTTYPKGLLDRRLNVYLPIAARGANVREYLVRWPLAGGGGDGAATTPPGGAAADAGLPPHILWVREVGPSAGGLLRTARGWLGACMAAVERDGNDVASD